MAKLTKQQTNFANWYQDVIAQARLAEHSVVKGCMVILPYGYAIWELIQHELDNRLKAIGIQNVYFPIFIPEQFLQREADHVKGFSPELAIVTIGGGKELSEKLIVRPTSETIIYDAMRKWVRSYRDLPIRINQWANAIRWELRPRLFLRTTEFLWQEGHTAYATYEEAAGDVNAITQLYKDFLKDFLAIPTIEGRKSENEKFAGAIYSQSIEGLMRDGRALQMGTVHHLGQNFSKPFGLTFTSRIGEPEFAYQTSWGVSTRLIGALIMVHGDDRGLRLPPRIAPTQVVIVPILGQEGEEQVLSTASQTAEKLRIAGIRVHLDDRDHLKAGAKYYEWELKGVPLRLEIGPRDVANGQIVMVPRVSDGTSKLPISKDIIVQATQDQLQSIQSLLLQQATDWIHTHTHTTTDKQEFCSLIENQSGFVRTGWCGVPSCELEIKAKTKATSRNLPLHDQSLDNFTACIWCRQPASCVAYFAIAY
jgi:prolyl-tRNA synthetase